VIPTDMRAFLTSKEQIIAEVKAAFFAAHAHRGQQYGSGPYTDHLFAARQVLADAEVGGSPCVAILLHDTIEDTYVLREMIADMFGLHVAALVWAVSGMPKGAPRKVRVADAHRKIRELPAAIVVKLADRIANVENCVKHRKRSLFEMYLSEQVEFDELLRDTHTEALYPEMVERLRVAFAGGCEG